MIWLRFAISTLLGQRCNERRLIRHCCGARSLDDCVALDGWPDRMRLRPQSLGDGQRIEIIFCPPIGSLPER